MLISSGCAGLKKTLVQTDLISAERETTPESAEKLKDEVIPDVRAISESFDREKKDDARIRPEPFYSEDLGHVESPDVRDPLPALSGVSSEPEKKKETRVSGSKARRRSGSRSGTAPRGQEVVLNFDDADLYDVIRNMAEILGINYILDSGVQGKVTIHTAGKLHSSELFPVFFQILEANGLTAVKEGSLYKIVSIKEAPRLPISSHFGVSDDIPRDERIIIQIIPLEFISVQEVTKLVTPFISAEGTIVSHEESDTLVVVDKHINILKVLKLIDAFDVNLFEKKTHRIFHLAYSDVNDISKTLTEIIRSYGTAKKDEVKFIPVERLNLLIVISSVSYLLDKAEEIIRQLDVPGDDIEPRIYVYAVKNGEAAELAQLLNGVFSRGDSGKKWAAKKVQTTPEKEKPAAVPNLQAGFGGTPPAGTSKRESASGASGSYGSGTLKGESRITPDEVRNALIIEATPRDYQIIENILNRLDVLPRQVLIEVKIAEIRLDTKTDLGVKWWFERQEGDDSGRGRVGAGVGSALFGASEAYAGLQYVIGQTQRWEAALSALSTENKINMLSAPTVLASDNKEAKINISTEVPVASAQYQYDSNSEPLLQTNIQYRNTGIILTVTPHINEYDLVSMDISQEVSNQLEDNVQVGNDSLPAFFKRSVNTSLTVKHGQTIVIGGLIQQNENKGFAGVPCLGKVPMLEYLFGNKSDSVDKSELIILITPRVITTLEDVDMVTESFKNRVKEMEK